jgi:hypothetical protein
MKRAASTRLAIGDASLIETFRAILAGSGSAVDSASMERERGI